MEGKHYTPEEIKNMLQKYYDFPDMISAEFAAIRKINSSGVDHLTPAEQMWAEEEIQHHMQNAQELATQHRFLQNTLPQLNQREQIMLQYRFMGPKDPARRRQGFPKLSWKAVGPLVFLSESRARDILSKTIKRLSELPVDPVKFG